MRTGYFNFFNADYIFLGPDYDWVTNPITNYKYSTKAHWTEIEDIDSNAGDIKYVWEKSRFSFIYDLIRYDYHFEKDCSKVVFNEIESWIDANPLNHGPNYKCSQEIAIRVLNWIFVLYYYQNSTTLTNELFQKILVSAYSQMHHVYKNINFSLKTVRNNHALTETAALYIFGILFPTLPQSDQWRVNGKKWHEQEILYQIYPDGTHLLFSTNYQRTVLVLLTWVVYISKYNDDDLQLDVQKRIFKGLNWLYQMTNDKNGDVPNYGPNDGSLFCKLNNLSFRDYRPQLNALHYYFAGKHLYKQNDIIEEAYWYNSSGFKNMLQNEILLQKTKLNSFEDGGNYVIQDDDTLSIIKCASYKDRPSQADNLHLDIWYNDENMLRDAGSYSYNCDGKLLKYFNGTSSHNTIMINDQDQMLKGPRFIWMYWSSRNFVKLEDLKECYMFEGSINAFKQLNSHISHKRTLKK